MSKYSIIYSITGLYFKKKLNIILNTYYTFVFVVWNVLWQLIISYFEVFLLTYSHYFNEKKKKSITKLCFLFVSTYWLNITQYVCIYIVIPINRTLLHPTNYRSFRDRANTQYWHNWVIDQPMFKGDWKIIQFELCES